MTINVESVIISDQSAKELITNINNQDSNAILMENIIHEILHEQSATIDSLPSKEKVLYNYYFSCFLNLYIYYNSDQYIILKSLIQRNLLS